MAGSIPWIGSGESSPMVPSTISPTPARNRSQLASSKKTGIRATPRDITWWSAPSYSILVGRLMPSCYLTPAIRSNENEK